MGRQLDTSKFLSLKKQEIGVEDDKLIKLEICTQSIFRWLQYCEYHYVNLDDAVKKPNLHLDRALNFKRAGDTVPVRYVYEANIAAFLHSLHALLDSFPYLLNLFIPVTDDPESTSIKWHQSFIRKYNRLTFYDQLLGFLTDTTFHKVKGYVNTIKHKHLIRISNQWDHLEFEEFEFKEPYFDDQKSIRFKLSAVSGQHVVPFIEECHNELIPKLFDICDSVLSYKESELANEL